MGRTVFTVKVTVQEKVNMSERATAPPSQRAIEPPDEGAGGWAQNSLWFSASLADEDRRPPLTGERVVAEALTVIAEEVLVTGAQPLSPAAPLIRLREAVLSRTPVSLGPRRTRTPHEFYRYPARFSPAFVEAAIKCFSHPDAVVLDPFVGGGTTAVEAMRLGRRAVVADLNPLATFITRAKTTILAAAQEVEVIHWLDALPEALNLDRIGASFDDWADEGYFRHLETQATWRIRKLVGLAITAIPSTDSVVEGFCRCVVLRTAQWALDMRSALPRVPEFRAALVDNGWAMLKALRAFSKILPAESHPPLILDQGVPGLAAKLAGMDVRAPSVVITSPPYPGVYVNYHRWKLLGRKEIRAPYWVANARDGHGLAHYTMHARSEPTLNTYFQRLREAFCDLAKLLDESSIVVQMVGFNNPDNQLPRYLSAMEAAGLEEVIADELASEEDGRLWRSVPGRRWWSEATTRKETVPHTSREVVLLHKVHTS